MGESIGMGGGKLVTVEGEKMVDIVANAALTKDCTRSVCSSISRKTHLHLVNHRSDRWIGA